MARICGSLGGGDGFDRTGNYVDKLESASVYHLIVRSLFERSKAVALMSAALFAFCGAGPSPEPSPSIPPDVADLRAKIELASGPSRAMERIVASVQEHGRTATLTTVRSGKNKRFTLQDGPFLTLNGTLDGQAWHQNENGLTVLDQPRPGGEASERRTVALRHVTAPIVADVIDELNPKGDGTKTYVDPTTYRVLRVERITPTETTVTTYDDFRMTAGRSDAWHEHTVDGHAENDRDERIVSIAASGVGDADVAVPAPRRALVTFPAGVTSMRLPATLDAEQHFIVRVTVGSRGLDFLLDTGSSGIVMDRAVAGALGLAVVPEGSSAANAGRYSEGEAIVSDMHVGTLDMKNVAVSVLPSLSFASRSGSVQVVGLLGFDFIASLALSLDYDRGTVSAIDYDAFKPPTDPQSIAVPIRVGKQGPETDVTIDGRLGERFEIDTGGVGGVMITDAFTRRYPGVTSGFRRLGDVPLKGVGGAFTTAYYTIPDMRLGGSTFKNFSALVIGSDRIYAGDFDGIIGPELLRYFTLTTDYADSTIYLEPNTLGKRARAQ